MPRNWRRLGENQGDEGMGEEKNISLLAMENSRKHLFVAIGKQDVPGSIILEIGWAAEDDREAWPFEAPRQPGPYCKTATT